MAAGAPAGPPGFDVATGTWLGSDPDAPALPSVDPGLTPRAALEEALRRALAHSPCVVSFSGGRDSSTLLAIAVHVARREQLPLPVPASLSFPAAPGVDESSWQEVVIRHLGIEDWFRLEIDDELELLGEESCALLRGQGVPVIPFMHVHAPLLRQARGGLLVTGFFANLLFDMWRWQRVASVAALRSRPAPRDVLRFALAAAPRATRRAALARRPVDLPPWLREGARKALLESQLAEAAGEPARWDRRVAWCARRRAREGIIEGFAAFGVEHDAQVEHPFADLTFLAALARAGGRAGFGGRTQAMQELAGDLLPRQVLTRSHRPDLGPVLWREHARAFSRNWSGEGIDPKVVASDELRSAWTASDPRSASLLQTAWLASASSPTRAGSGSPTGW